jgi:AmiR/NasT family two-component response regulator
MDGFLVKPLDAERLREAIQSAVGSKSNTLAA